MQFKKTGFLLLISGLVLACSSNQVEMESKQTGNAVKPVRYAKRFNIENKGEAMLVSVLGNKNNTQVTSRFIIANDTNTLRKKNPGAFVIKSPCTKIAALSSIYANMLFELGNLNQLVAIDNADYIINPEIMALCKSGKLKQVAKSAKTDVEKVVRLQPDILFTFGMGKANDADKILLHAGVPVAISVDHLEADPLARAEWIKFFAVFAGSLNKADSIFNAVERNYLRLAQLAKETSTRPTVFSEIKYSEFWYMPGGNSNVAKLLADAGASFLWNDNPDSGSQTLSFEQVYVRAKEADYWINLSTLNTKKELKAYDSRYASFKAFQTNHLFNNNKNTNQFGYSNYWETGMIFPDRVISDLIQIFHPELKPQIKNDLYYYKQLTE